jgi:hypothetical protein
MNVPTRCSWGFVVDGGGVLVMLHKLEVTELQGSSSACEWTLCQDLHLPNDGAPAIQLMGLWKTPDCRVL